LAAAPIIYIVCSDRHRNGKTLLARVLVDYLMLDGHDPFVIDAGHPEGPLRAFFPGRTVLVDFIQMQGRMKLFDTILESPGRDYVIDLPAPQTAPFFEAVAELGFAGEARAKGFALVVLFIVDRTADSLKAAAAIARNVMPDLLVPVRNAHVGSALDDTDAKLVIDMPVLDRAAATIIASKRFSLRSFLLGDEAGMQANMASRLKSFLYELMTGFREIEPVMSLSRLRPRGHIHT
jgi:hypothetical protein